MGFFACAKRAQLSNETEVPMQSETREQTGKIKSLMESIYTTGATCGLISAHPS